MRTSKRGKKICPFCGREFMQVNTNQIYCSSKCCANFGKGNVPRKSVEAAKKSAMLARLRARDAAYAKAFPDDARGNVRGRRIVASKCGTINDACGFIRTFG